MTTVEVFIKTGTRRSLATRAKYVIKKNGNLDRFLTKDSQVNFNIASVIAEADIQGKTFAMQVPCQDIQTP